MGTQFLRSKYRNFCMQFNITPLLLLFIIFACGDHSGAANESSTERRCGKNLMDACHPDDGIIKLCSTQKDCERYRSGYDFYFCLPVDMQCIGESLQHKLIIWISLSDANLNG